MSYLSNNSFALPALEFEELPTSAIFLEPEDINRAAEFANQITDESNIWEIYLNTLALSAFEKWLESRGNIGRINTEECTILQPALAQAINGVANLEVGDFKICLIVTGSLTSETVALPRAIVDLPEFIPHFYVLVEVLEEQDAANIYAFLSYKELANALDLQLESDWTYEIPLSCFDNNPDRLLLYLRCLEPEAIRLPAIPTNRSATLSTMESELVRLLPQLNLSQMYSVLTWEQATAVLITPELLDWVYNKPIATSNLSDLFKLLVQPVLNAGRWLWDELDEVAQSLSWVLLPNFAPASAMRSPVEEFEIIVTQLRQRGLEIPVQARGAYQDLLLAGVPLRIYAVTWHLLTESEQPEWSLLLILGAPVLGSLPANVKLRVSDQTGVLVERGVDEYGDDSYVFTRVIGDLDERFLVNVSLMDGVEVTLPAFGFDLRRA